METAQLPILNFPENYRFRLKKDDKKLWIFCIVRKHWIINSPEEWVRQHFIHFLTYTKKYPLNGIAVELEIPLNGTKKRADIVFFKLSKPFLIIECKSPEIELGETVFEQIIRYNSKLNATFMVISNGLNHIYLKPNFKNKSLNFITEIPNYQ